MKLTYEIFASQACYPDTAYRMLVIEVNGTEVKSEKYHYPVNSFGEYTFNSGDNVSLSLTELDVNNNDTLLTVLEFVASKDYRPEQDEPLQVKCIKQEVEESLPNYKDRDESKPSSNFKPWNVRQ